MMPSTYTNIIYFAATPRPALFLATRVAGCDKITALLSNCHLNRKFAYRNDRNDASEACTKAHRTEAPCSTYREKFDDTRIIDTEICPFFYQANSLSLQIEFCRSSFVELRETSPLCAPMAQLRFVRDSRDGVRVNAFTSVADNLRGSLLPEIARVFPTTSIPQVR